jgi:3-methyl-2-oxobutanoate hydroxymethyltransferase
MLHHVKAVRRGVKDALLVADMPYGSYHVDAHDTVRNAMRFVKEGGAEVVKMEGGEKRADLIRQVIDAEIPVAGHIGLTPQSLNRMGGFKVQGKTLADIEQLMRDATALDRAGVACIFLEGIPREVADMITNESYHLPAETRQALESLLERKRTMRGRIGKIAAVEYKRD